MTTTANLRHPLTRALVAPLLSLVVAVALALLTWLVYVPAALRDGAHD